MYRFYHMRQLLQVARVATTEKISLEVRTARAVLEVYENSFDSHSFADFESVLATVISSNDSHVTLFRSA